MVKASDKEKYYYKVVLIGDARVGKTSLRKNFMGESFEAEYLTTLMADFASHTLELDDFIVNFSIWDLAGQPNLKDVRTKYYYGAFGAILVLDVINPSSFGNLDLWIDQLKLSTMSKGVPLVIAANKIDLLDNEEEGDAVKFSEVESYIDNLRKKYDYDIMFIKTSAKTGENVEDAFRNLALAIKSWKDSESQNRE